MPSTPGRADPRRAGGRTSGSRERLPGALAGSYGQELRPGPSGKIAPAAYDGADRRATAPHPWLKNAALSRGFRLCHSFSGAKLLELPQLLLLRVAWLNSSLL